MAEDQSSKQNKQGSQTGPSDVAQPQVQAPIVPKQPNPQPAAQGTEPAKPVFVQLVGGDELEPFEEQSLAISRQSLAISQNALQISRQPYWIAILAFAAAAIAAAFVGVQVKEMSYQTQIMASQSEGANAGALMDEMNTRKQLAIAQQQARAAQDQVRTLQQNFIKEERPYVWFTNQPQNVNFDPVNKCASWTEHITNYGKSTAEYAVDKVLEVGPDAYAKILRHTVPPIRRADAFNRMPPGKDDFFTAHNCSVSQRDWEEALKHDGWIIIAGTLSYYDQVGNLYTVDFCDGRGANGSSKNLPYAHRTVRAKQQHKSQKPN